MSTCSVEAQCSIEGCPKESRARGWCPMHYQRWRHFGSTSPRAFPSPEDRFWARVDRRGDNECWEWTGRINAWGYGTFDWQEAGERMRPGRAHRFAWFLATGEYPPDGLCVCHHCDNPPCVNPNHLFLGTHRANALDKEQKGRGNHPSGERNGSCKVSDAEVLQMRDLYAAGWQQLEIAPLFSISSSHVSRLVRGDGRQVSSMAVSA